MSTAPVLPPEIVALPADPLVGAVVIPFRHRAAEPPPESEPQPDSEPDSDEAAGVAPRVVGSDRLVAMRQVRTRAVRGRQGAVPRDAVRPGTRVVRAAGRPTPKLRLTRRGKVVITVAGLLGALAFGMLSARVIRAQATVPASAPAVVQVQPGDTVWSIAERVAPRADTRAVVDAIISRNNLVGGAVHPGQRLIIRP
jgi:LysM domain